MDKKTDSHKCNFDYNNVKKEKYFYYCECKHPNCKFIVPTNAVGRLLYPYKFTK